MTGVSLNCIFLCFKLEKGTFIICPTIEAVKEKWKLWPLGRADERRRIEMSHYQECIIDR